MTNTSAVVSDHFTPGQPIEVRDAYGRWLPAVADSRVERGHRFHRVWVLVEGHRMPWPETDVRQREGQHAND